MTAPTDLPKITFGTLEVHEPFAVNRPTPLTSLVASARRISSEQLEGRSFNTSQDWQQDAWEMFDLVGEHRYLTTTLAGRLSQARLYVGRRPQVETDDPEPANEPEVQAILEAFGKTSAGRSQLMKRMAVNLSVTGDGWFVGIPPMILPASERPHNIDRILGGTSLDDTDPADLEWRMLSVSEVSSRGTNIELSFGAGREEKVECSPDDIYLVRVWNPHPRRWWEADSPTRASLPVLRELVGLTMKIAAQVDSRLAGAGVFIVPQSAKTALLNQLGMDADTEEDPFTEAMMEAMLTPIQDRASASAVVPLVFTVPDEAADKFRHITFDRPMDTEDRPLREEAIRRLALSQDAPPEVLLGTAGMNHWGGWLVKEDVVSTHIEPPLSLVCDALTTQYLWPVLEEMGYDDFEEYVIWYDVSHLITRPNHSSNALVLHERGVIGDATLRFASGFDEIDAPYGEDVDIATQMVIGMVQENPGLIQSPGVPYLLGEVRALITGQVVVEEEPADVPPTDDAPPTDEDAPPSDPTQPPDGPTTEGPPEGPPEP